MADADINADYAARCLTCLSVVGMHYPIRPAPDALVSALVTLHAAHRTVEGLLPVAEEFHTAIHGPDSPIRDALFANRPIGLGLSVHRE